MWYAYGERRRKIMECKEYMITLDEIINIMLIGGTSGGDDPAFVQMCEKKVANELLEYTGKIAMESGTAGREAAWMENEAGTLMDTVCEAHRIYLKMGIKLGAGLVLQLLGM